MAKFVTCIRNKRNDGYYPVYIRVFHNKEIQYINTGFVVNEKGLRTVYDEKGKSSTEVSDRFVLAQCNTRIEGYIQKVNHASVKNMNCKDLIKYITDSTEDLSFTDYAKKYIDKMINEGRDNHARNYKLSVSRLKEFMKKENIFFKDLTSSVIDAWIYSMKDSARKKSLYPTCIRAMFNAALKEYNDYDFDIIRIRNNPFVRWKFR